MELVKFILWLSAGAVIGWVAGQIVMVEHRRTHIPVYGEGDSSEKS